jgi:FKBP-type peptidyl-prolyl cis-trans isomerase (trigger factor)
MFENGGHFSVVTYRAMKEYLLNKKMTPLIAEQAIRAIPDSDLTDSEKKQMLYHLSEVMLNFTMLPESVIQDLLHWEEPTLGVTKDDIFETINIRRQSLGLPEETEENLMISTMI